MTLMQSTHMIEGLPKFTQPKDVCTNCLISNQFGKSFPCQSKFSATTTLELVHCDLFGPIPPEIYGGNKYFMLLDDDYSRVMWAYFLE